MESSSCIYTKGIKVVWKDLISKNQGIKLQVVAGSTRRRIKVEFGRVQSRNRAVAAVDNRLFIVKLVGIIIKSGFIKVLESFLNAFGEYFLISTLIMLLFKELSPILHF